MLADATRIEVPESNERFCLFVYGTLRSDGPAAHFLDGSERLGAATVEGTLYDLEEYPALLLYGSEPVHGEIWSCPVAALPLLDSYERVDRGLFRRVAVEASGIPCWTYAAGPALASRLTPNRKLDGRWQPGSS